MGLAAASGLLLLSLACGTAPRGLNAEDDAVPSKQTTSQFQQGRVVSVVDGATIDVDIDGQIHRVRYIGVEVPENGSDGALRFNRFLVENGTVQLERDAVESDASGNLLRYVYVDGEMINEALLVSGYAVTASIPPGFQYQTSFMLAEENAKASSRGIWGYPFGGQEAPQDAQMPVSTSPVPEFTGGTLPQIPASGKGLACDFSGTAEPVIKGVVDSKTGMRAYFAPTHPSYGAVVVDASKGGQWFCTEDTAISLGWKKAPE